jgi:hypothetical protein
MLFLALFVAKHSWHQFALQPAMFPEAHLLAQHYGYICILAVAGKSGQPVLSRYDLLANVVHDGKAGEGSYRCHIHRKVQCCCAGAVCQCTASQ